MKKLPVVRWKLASETQRESLARWLREREFQLGTRNERQASPIVRSGPREPGPLDSLIAPFDGGAIRPGEIRLLSSWLLPDADRPVYIAVLSDWEDGLKLVAPYGSLGEPATSGELRAERDAPALAVLCLWNAHSAPEELLARSWLVDLMSAQELADAWSVFQHVATGRPLPESLAGRVGLPILDEEDPRIAYQREEAAMLAPIAGAALAAAGIAPVNIVELPVLVAEYEEAQLAYAADSGRASEARQILDVPGRGLSIRIFLDSDHSTAVLIVHDAAGELALGLDGAAILDRVGAVLTTISGSFARFPFGPAVSGIGVRLASGEEVPLIRR